MLYLVCLIYTITAGWREGSSFTGFMCQSVSLLGARHVTFFKQTGCIYLIWGRTRIRIKAKSSNRSIWNHWSVLCPSVMSLSAKLYAKLASSQQSVCLCHPWVYRVSAAELRKTQNYNVSLIRRLVWELSCWPKALTQCSRTIPPCCSIRCPAKRHRSGSTSQITKHESAALVQLPHGTHLILPQEGQTEAQVHSVFLMQEACIMHISMVLIRVQSQ